MTAEAGWGREGAVVMDCGEAPEDVAPDQWRTPPQPNPTRTAVRCGTTDTPAPFLRPLRTHSSDIQHIPLGPRSIRTR